MTERRSRRAQRSPRCPEPTRDAELSNVLAEIAYLMEAEGALISLHSAAGGAPELLGACVSDAVGGFWRDWLDDARLYAFGRSTSLDLMWVRSNLDDNAVDVLLLPVSPIAGHNRMVVTVLFLHPTRATRDEAERLFATRRPIAMGYFRLWQQERVKARRLAALEAACDITDLGIMLFTSAGGLDFANGAAAELLAMGDGLRRHRISVRATEIGDDVKLQVALNHAIAANDGGEGAIGAPRQAPLVRLRRRSGEPLIAMVVAATARAVEPSDIAAMVYLFDPALDMKRLLKPVCDAFRLSPAETQLACHLALGLSITDSAEQLRIQVQTARGYLKNIFIKTDTRRQGELVHLMLSNIFRIGRTISPQVL